MAVQEETKQLIDWQTSQDPEIGNLLVERYMPLVDYVTHRISLQVPPTVDRDEIRSLALLGLFDALKKYETTFSTKFETYATWRIKGAVLDGLRKLDWLPRSLRDQVKMIDRATIELQQVHQREVTDEEVADHLEMHVAEVKRIVRHSSLAVVSSIHQETFQEDEIDTGAVANPPTTPEKQVVRSALFSQIEESIHRLPEKEKLVVALAYQEEMRFTEIAEILNVSISRVSQLHSKAMARLRHSVYDVLDY